jgi:hypothetical protein
MLSIPIRKKKHSIPIRKKKRNKMKIIRSNIGKEYYGRYTQKVK